MSTVVIQAIVNAIDDPALRDLVTRYELAKAKAESAASNFEELKLELKGVLFARAPNVRSVATLETLKDQQSARIDLWVPGTQPYVLEARSRWTVDSKGMKEKDPAAYARWAKRGITWYLTHPEPATT